MSAMRKAALLSMVVIPLTVGGFAIRNSEGRDGSRLFDQVFRTVSTQFVDTIDTDQLYEKAAHGLIRELNDPYSALVTPAELAAFTVETAGRYGGIGLLIERYEGEFVVNRVFPHSPGEEAGVLVGDRILTVDGQPTQGWPLDKVSGALKGDPGTKVVVDFARAGVDTPIELHLTRAVVHIPSVPFTLMLEGKVGYVPLQKFSETSSKEVEAAVYRLIREGARGLVLDLRGNGGGYTDQALSIANLFLARGEAVYTQVDRGRPPLVYRATKQPLAPKLPLAVLTDGATASASEIVAGALQDHDRALILGTTSFGKGLVQSVYTLEGGYVLKMTTGRWLTPSGRSIHKYRLAGGTQAAAAEDSMETDSARLARPRYRSDAGRTVYGGGAITPDVMVQPDTLTTPEQEFVRAIAPKSQEATLALRTLAEQLKLTVKPDFQIEAKWRDEFYRRLIARGLTIERGTFDAAGRYVDRMLEHRVARTAFGDSTAQRRAVDDDVQLRRALELVQKGRTQRELLTLSQGVEGEAQKDF